MFLHFFREGGGLWANAKEDCALLYDCVYVIMIIKIIMIIMIMIIMIINVIIIIIVIEIVIHFNAGI